MKKALVFLITVLGILSLAAQSNMFLQLSEEQITPEIYEQIERNNAQVRGPSFNFVSTPYNLPDNADIADPLTGRFNEDTPWTKDFSRHVVNPEGNQLYFYFSNTEHFIITQPDSGNPLKLRFQPIPTHWYGSELMVITVSDEPLDRTNRATATAIIRINVSSVPDPPLFVNLPAGNIFTIDEDASLSVNFRDYINCIDSSIENFDLYVMQTQAPIGPETYNVMVSQAPNIYTGHQVTFTPQPDYNNPIGVRFIVTAVDRGSSAFSTVEIIVRIIPENDPPQIVSYLPANLEFTIDQNKTQAFSAVTQDADNDVLAHEWLLEGLLNGIPFSNVVSTNADLSYLFDVPGTYTLTYTVSDNWTQDSIQWTIHVRPIGPLFNPVGGVFDHAITVTLTAPAGFEAAIIYYTLDGSLPVPGAPGTFVYDQPIPLETLGNIENIKTIRALYVHPDFPPSQVVSYNYRITGQVAELVFNPVGGTYYSQVAVNITCPNAGATIWYTTDGSDPIPGDPDTFEYTGPIVIPTGNSMVIKAMATRADWIDSPTRTEAYNVTGVVTIVSHTMTPPPLPDGEFYTVELGESMPVEILGLTLLPPSATLYYTLDSSIPGPTNPAALIYTPGLEIPLTCPTWITFRAYNPDWLPSTIYTYFYDVRTRTKIVPFVNGTVFDPVPGTYTAPVMVSLSLETVPANAPVYYTTDGTDPIDDPALLYTGPIAVSSATTIKVIARDPSICPSDIYTGHYVITGQLEMPQFSPPPSSYQVPEPITIYHDRPGVTIYYTLNGDDPDEFANLYSAPINLPSGTHTIKARAYLADWIPSNIRTGVYRFGYLPVPVFNLEGGIYTAPIVVELSSTVAGASILYTTTVGGVPSTLYNTGIPVGNLQPETVTIRAKATRAGWADSDVVEREFTVTGTVAMPSFNPPGSDGPFNGTVNVTIATATPGAQIKYTLDGQDPSESYGIVYAGPVAIAQSATLKARAFLADWAPSAIRTDVYTILGDIAMPVFTPAAGTYTGPVNVFISVNPPDAQIYYTADGTIPTAATGIPYVAGTPIPVSGTSLLQAIAVKPGWNDSPIATALYTITGTVAAPVIAPVSGTYYSTQTITITSATPGATIVYTTDGTEPSRLNGLPYDARPFNLGAGVWAVKAMAWLDTWADSPVTVNNYVIIINPPIANPVFSPPGGYYNDPVDVTITAAPADATIYYTLDGTIPSLSNGTAYSDPISVNAYTQIKAIAIRANWPNSGVSTADYYFRVASPVLSVPSGAYDSPQSVSMSVTTPGALIRYTTDGSDPSGVDGTLYDGTPVLISNTTQATTVKAIAYLGGWVNSSIVTYTYVINPPVADPFFSVQGGDYYSVFTVSMTTLPANASIYYTTDGSDPSEVNGTLYTVPVAITRTTTLKAKAYMVNYQPSDIKTAVYNLYVRPVSFNPPGGTYNANQNVILSTITPGATIWYTTDGTDPIPGSSAVYDPLNPILVDHNLTIKAIAGLNNWFSSPITTANYIIDIPLPNIAVVQILPPSGVYTAPVDVSMSVTTPGAVIRYTTDGTEPTLANGDTYSVPFTVGVNTTVNARAFLAGWNPSAFATAQYIIVIPIQTVATPTFSPDPGVYDNSVTVSISTTTPDANIYYTTNGVEPDDNSTLYTDPITLTSTTNVKAVAYKNGMNRSLISNASYVINIIIPNVEAPVFSLASGLYYAPIDVAITTGTADAEIWYSFDGSDPTPGAAGSMVDSGAINIPGNSTRFIKARAYKTGWNTSPVVSANYNVTGTVADIQYSVLSGTYTTPQSLVLTTLTSDATIRYTTDGSDPTATSTPYITAIPINISMTVKARGYKTNWLPGNPGMEVYVITGSLAFDQPSLSPAPGTFGNAINVTIANPIPSDADVYYTTDGTVPSATNGTLYSGPIAVNAALTLKAVALKAGWVPAYLDGTYGFQAATPGFLPGSGSYPNAQLVSLSTSTDGASIRYTTDGTDPSALNGSVYSAPISVEVNQTIKAYAFKPGYLDSPIVAATYAIGTYIPVVDTPVLNPASGTFTETRSVAMSVGTPGAVIRYTTDGSEPTEASDEYTAPVSLALNTVTTIKAKAFKVDWMPSATTTELYVITGQVAAPMFIPPAGSYTAAQNVVLTSATEGAFFRYTLDGSDPVAGSPLYTTPINVPQNLITTIKARAYKSGWADSDVSTAVYNVTGKVAFTPPAFTPPSGTYATGQMINISAPVPASATVKYTIDGTLPSRTNGIEYTAPFSLATGATVQAIAYLDGWEDSQVVSAQYNFNVAAPVYTPQSGTYPSLQVTIGSATPGSQIRYTMDGSDPSDTVGTLYTGPIDLAGNNSYQFKAVAYLTGWQPSTIVPATYLVTGTVADVVFSIPSGTYTTAQNLVLSTPTSGAAIYYTTDGSEPTQVSTLYTTAIVIPLNSSLTVRARAYRDAWLPSGITVGVYNVTGTTAFDQPLLTPAPGTYANSINVMISQPIPATAQVYYTTDGSLPSETNGTLYRPPIPVDNAMTIRAVAIRAGWLPSYISGTYDFMAAAPGFTPPAGSYDSTQNVVLGSATVGASIRYTTDGTDPSPSNGLTYTGSIVVNINQTIKAYAFKPGYQDSPIVSATYAIGTYVPVVATPVFSPLPGSFTAPVSVSISTDTPGATIRYTTDGSDPTPASDPYLGPINVPNHTVMTIKAIAYKDEWDPSQIAVGTYTVTGTVQDVVFNPLGGSYTTAQNVVITTPTPGAAIFYTLDGSDPTESSSQYTQAVQLGLNSTTTIKARAYVNGWTPSAIGSQTYVITGQVTIPGQVFTPVAGTYTTAQPVTISTTTLPAGATIRYTENGTDPTATSPIYTGQTISVPLNTVKTVKARAFLAGWDPSPVYEAVYNVTGTIVLPAATFTPVAGTYQTAQNITINPPAIPSGASLYYTLNGIDPTEASLLYQGPIALPENSGPTTIKVRAYKTGWVPSAIASATYTITGTVAYMTPVFLPDPTVIYTSPVNVTINNVTPTDAIRRYTLDGSEPSLTNGFTYPTTPINLALNTSTTIKTKAFKTDWTASQTYTATYTVTGQVSITAPVFTPPPGTFINPQSISVSNTTVPAGAVVRYTLDGSEPTATSPIYSAAIPAPAYATTRIKVKAFANNWQASPTYEGVYVINGAAIINGPVFTPPAGTYTTAQSLVISNNTLPSNASIYYTTDGSDPTTTNGTLYTDAIPLNLDQQITVKVRAYGDANWDPSIVHSASYNMTGQVIIPPLVFSPNPGVVYQTATLVTIGAPVPSSATIHYTTDGSVPTQASAVYSAPIEVPLNTLMTIKTRAYLASWDPSPVYEATYAVTGQVQLAASPFSPAPGTYTSAQTVTIAAPVLPVQGAILRYTLTPDLADPADALDPDSTATQYTGPITVPLNSNWVIKIRGFSRDWIDSEVIAVRYVVTGNVEAPDFYQNSEPITAELFHDPLTIELRSATEGAMIYYTVAVGSDPAIPDETATLFDPAQPIAIPELSFDVRIRAKAFKTDWIPSSDEIHSFTVIPLPYDVRAFTYGGYIRLLWNFESGKALDGFDIYRRKTSEAAWTKQNTTPVLTMLGTDYYYDDYAIQAGTSYVYRVVAIYNGVESNPSETTTIEYQSGELDISPATYAYPNPAGSSTKIKLVLTRNDNVQVAVSIYDFSGKKVRTLTVPPTNSNLIEIPWDLNNSSHKKVGRGTYFARIVANDGVKKAERTIKISVK